MNFVDPVYPGLQDIDNFNRYLYPLYGRRLNAGEVGCALAHYNAQKLALELDADVAWFFEDDAEIEPSTFLRLTNELSLLEPSSPNPHALSLFTAGIHRSWIKETSVSIDGFPYLCLKRFVAPQSTVAYALNKSSLALISKSCSKRAQVPFGKADFPSWAAEAEWRVLAESPVRHMDEAPSTILGRLDQKKRQSKLFQLGLLSLRLLSLISPIPKLGFASKFGWLFAEHFYSLLAFGEERNHWRSELQEPHEKGI